MSLDESNPLERIFGGIVFIKKYPCVIPCTPLCSSVYINEGELVN